MVTTSVLWAPPVGGSELPLAKLRQLLETGAYLLARREADRLLAGDLTGGQRAIVLQMACRASLGLRDPFGAAKLGQLAIDSALAAEDMETLADAHLAVGQAFGLIGDPTAAEQHLECYFALRPSRAERWDGAALHALARAYQQQRAYPAAVERLEQAIALYEAAGQLFDRTEATLDLARCFLLTGSPELAEPHLDWVSAHLGESRSPAVTALLLSSRALLARLKGDIAESARLCQELFVPDRPGVTPYHIGEAAWVMGENALDLRRLEEAHLFTEWALDHAMRANCPNLMNRILELKRRIAAQMQAKE